MSSVANVNTGQTLTTIMVGDTAPDKVHIVTEKYAADGTLLVESKHENVGVTSPSPIFYVLPEFNCQDGVYVVISAYERQDFTKLISKCIVKPVTLNFANFN